MKRRDLIIGGVLLIIATVVPFLGLPRYFVTQITIFFIWATVVSQWNLVLGVAGIFSLAQMALFAFGGYATAMLGFYFEWSLWLALPVAASGAVLFSAFVGIACLRLRGPYVALLTLAIAVVMYQLIITDTDCIYYEGALCRTLTENNRGLGQFGDFGFRALMGRDFIIGNYFVGLALLTLATLFSFYLIHSPLGLAFRALRDNQGYAISRGISRFKFQIVVFVCSAFFTGLAGGVYAGVFKVIGPNVLYLSLLLYLLSMMVVGGLGRAWGPLVGAAALMLADEAAREFANYRNIGLGLILAAFVIAMPEGIVGGIENLWTRLRGRPSPEG